MSAALRPTFDLSFDLTFDTVDGGEDLLITDLGRYGAARRTGPGRVGLVAAATGDLLGRLRTLHGFGGVTVNLGGTPTSGEFSARLGRLAAAIEQNAWDGRRGYRIAPDRTPGARDAAMIMTRLGWQHRPADWTINLVPQSAGWSAQLGPLHWSRRVGRLRRLPWSTPAALADLLARMAKIEPGQVVLDPCCGSGTILVTAGLVGAGRLIGIDRDRHAVSVAADNVTRLVVPSPARVELRTGDAGRLAAVGLGAVGLGAVGAVDRVISNLPFGKQVGSHRDNGRLYPDLLAGIARVLGPSGRAVLLTDDKRLLVEAVQRTRGLKIVKHRVFRYGGVTPTAYVIARRRR